MLSTAHTAIFKHRQAKSCCGGCIHSFGHQAFEWAHWSPSYGMAMPTGEALCLWTQVPGCSIGKWKASAGF
jgi:hypothetical protein